MHPSARRLGARYLLSGSVQRGATEIRIIAELIDASDGKHLWSSRLDRSSTDPFAVQDDISAAVIDAISGERGVIMREMHQEAIESPAVSFGEYDYYLKGHASYVTETEEVTRKAIAIWEEGLARFPNSSLLKIKLAWGHDQLYYIGASDTGSDDLDKALRYATEAFRGDDLPQLARALGHWAICSIHSDAGNWKLASPDCRRTRELMPNDPYVRHGLAWSIIAEGKLDEAEQMLSTLTPQAPNARWGYAAYMWLLFARGEYERCVGAADIMPYTLLHSLPLKAACLAALGRTNEASKVVEELTARSSEASVDFFRTYHSMALDEVVEREAKFLRNSGLREHAP